MPPVLVSNWGWNKLAQTQGAPVVKNAPASGRRRKRRRFDPWVRKTPWRRAWQPTPAFLPGESYGQRSLVDYSPGDREESDMTKATEHIRMVA